MKLIDLHTHTTASDGTYSPTELVKMAKETGLSAVAVTDHDTTRGLEESIEAGRKFGIEVIPGCELSVEFKGGQMHIIGLWLPLSPRHLEEELEYLRNKRHQRNRRIIEKLRDLGIEISYGDVFEVVEKGATVGRPHIARTLVNKGIVSSVDEAFKKFIGPQGLAYVPKEKFSPEKAIGILKREGATIILAHPFSLNLSPSHLKKEIERLRGLGLEGMEVYYSEHTQEQTREYLCICREMGLLVSGGSDFHGAVKKGIHLGRGRGNLKIPYDLVEEMKKYRKNKGLPC